MSSDLATLDAHAQAELVRRGEVTPVELVDSAIARDPSNGRAHLLLGRPALDFVDPSGRRPRLRSSRTDPSAASPS